MSNIASSPRFNASYKLATEIITPETELEYVEKAKKGNLLARDLLFSKYLPLLHKMASSIRAKYNATVDEMIDAAFLGIPNAIRQYSADADTTFGTYFMYHAYNMMKKCGYSSLIVKHSEKKLKELGAAGNTEHVSIASLDAKDEYGLTGLDSLTSPNTDPADMLAYDKECREIISNALHGLTAKELVVVKRLYLGDHAPTNLRDIGKELGVSHERIRQIRNSALARIQKNKRVVKQLSELR